MQHLWGHFIFLVCDSVWVLTSYKVKLLCVIVH